MLGSWRGNFRRRSGMGSRSAARLAWRPTTGNLYALGPDHEALPDSPLIVMIPASIRFNSSAGVLGNKVSATLATPPTNVADPAERLALERARRPSSRSHSKPRYRRAWSDHVSDFAPPALTARAAPGRVRDRPAEPAAAVQPDDLERSRPERAGLPVRRRSCSRTTRSR